jgi:hypothetical protein
MDFLKDMTLAKAFYYVAAIIAVVYFSYVFKASLK